jgi:hypothetical protein
MTINAADPGPFISTPNGVTTDFTFASPLLDEAHVLVELVDAAGIRTTQVLATDYTVTLNTSGDTEYIDALISFVTAPAVAYTKAVLSYNIPNTQLLDYIKNGKFAASSHELGLDKLTLLIVQLLNKSDRSIVLSEDVADSVSRILENPSALEIIGWDSAALNLRNFTVAELGALPTILNKHVDTFVDGVDFTAGTTTVITPTTDPLAEENTLVTFDGLTQHKSTYTFATGNITFDAVIPLGVTEVEVMYTSAP